MTSKGKGKKIKIYKCFQWPGSGAYFHYLHHKHFDCNYGGAIIPLDILFGTFASCKFYQCTFNNRRAA